MMLGLNKADHNTGMQSYFAAFVILEVHNNFSQTHHNTTRKSTLLIIDHNF